MSRGDFIHLMTKFRILLTACKSLKPIMVVFVMKGSPKHAKILLEHIFDFKAIKLNDSSFLRTICN